MKSPVILRRLRHPLLQGVLLALLLSLLICRARRTTTFSENLELPAYDLVTRLSWPWKAGHPDLVLVTVQEDFPEAELRDDTLAKALERLVAADPSLICIDLMRDRKVEGVEKDGFERLSKIGLEDRVIWIVVESFAKAGPVAAPCFMMNLKDKEETLDIWLRKVASATFAGDDSLGGRITRRGSIATNDGFEEEPDRNAPDNHCEKPAIVAGSGTPLRSFQSSLASLIAWRHAATKLGIDEEEAHDRLFGLAAFSGSTGGYWLADASGKLVEENDFLLKPVRDPAGRFHETTVAKLASGERDDRIPILSLSEVLHAQADLAALHRALAGKVILFGTHSDNIAPDPVAVVGDPQLRGIRLHALAASQLLRELEGEAPIRVLDDTTEDASVFAAALLASAFLGIPRLSPLVRAILGLLVLPGLLLGVAVWSLSSGVWLPAGAPVAACALTGLGGLALRWRSTTRESSDYLQLMSVYLGPQVTSRVLERNEELLAGKQVPTETFEATAMFADLRGYTAAAQEFHDQNRPDDFFAWLNGLLQPAVEIAARHGGFIKQFVGDEIYVIFGFPPEHDHDHARRAIACARELAELIPDLNRKLPDGTPRYHLRIGIYSGPIHANAVGGGRHVDYSFLGPTINKAARLQGLHKDRFHPEVHPVRILLGDPTRMILDDHEGITRYGDEPIAIDSRLPPEPVWEAGPAIHLQGNELDAS